MQVVKEKKQFKREYVPVVICGIILVILVIALCLVIFYKKDSAIKIPDVPKIEGFTLGVVNFNDANTDPLNLNIRAAKEADVTYSIISDYYKQGIMLANPQVEFYNDKFIIHSSSFGDTAFISSVSKDGKLEWLRKIKDKDYENIHIKKVLYMDKSYIAIAEGIKKTSKDLLAIKVTLNGEVEKIEIIENGFKNNIKSALMLDNQIGIITDTFENIKIYYLGSNLKLSNKTYSLNEQPDNVFLTYQPWVVGQVYKDKKLTIILGYMGNTDNNMYKLVVDPLTNKSKLTVHSVFEELGVSTQAISGGSGLLVQRDKKLNLYGTDDKLMNTFDYSKVKIEKLEDYKDKVQLMGEENWDDIKNELTIDNVYLTNGSWLVKTETLFHINFDLFDSNLNIRKRVMLDKSLYEYPDAILLKTFYVNNTIYEVYSYGLETPSIMVSVITMGA